MAAGQQSAVHLEPVAEDVQHEQHDEAHVQARVQHAQDSQQAAGCNPVECDHQEWLGSVCLIFADCGMTKP